MLRGACVAPTVKPRHKPDPADIRKTVACSLIHPTKVGPPVHDDLVERDSPPRHQISCGWLILPSIRPQRASCTCVRSKTHLSNRIVGYCMDSQIEIPDGGHRAEQRGCPAVVRWPAAFCTPTGVRNSVAAGSSTPSADTRWARWGRVGAAGDNAAMGRLFLQPAAKERPGPSPLGHPRRITDRDRHLDRTDLPPAPTSSRTRPVDPIDFETIMTTPASQAA